MGKDAVDLLHDCPFLFTATYFRYLRQGLPFVVPCTLLYLFLNFGMKTDRSVTSSLLIGRTTKSFTVHRLWTSLGGLIASLVSEENVRKSMEGFGRPYNGVSRAARCTKLTLSFVQRVICDGE